eukprot:gb/GECG01010786.1/.p1 GENE.gb/GECG01010786.1/~~gb/GECG01010786.1/.p1  ORF type:complete len:461 (+),score=48.25 gb/GECG01010786.1/:1-1383(+)
MFSQFYILSPRGDTIISKDFRGDCPSGSAETFFRKVKFWKGDAPPIFNVEGINFLHVKKTSLYFVGTTKFNVSPSLAIELLDRLAKVFKDYCGLISEEALRKNFVLIYELLDEMMDYGYAQATSTEQLKMYIHNEPIMVNHPPSNPGLKLSVSKTTPASSVNKPISLSVSRKGKKNEIFVDILERLSVVFNANGYVLNSTIDGTIQMKSFLSGNPPLRIALNEDLMIGRDEAAAGPLGYGGVVLDDANFHECINLDDFEAGRVLHLIPPEGEFAAMNYRCTGEFRPPFRVFPFLEEVTSYKIELVLKVRADIPARNYGANVTINFPTPKHATTVHPEVGSASGPKPATTAAADTSGGTMGTPAQGQTAEFDQKTRMVTWKIKKFQGGSEHTLRTKITLSQTSGASLRKELAPVRMSFEIPMYNASGLQVRYLHIAEDSKSYKPYRWVRYVSTTDNYVIRL